MKSPKIAARIKPADVITALVKETPSPTASLHGISFAEGARNLNVTTLTIQAIRTIFDPFEFPENHVKLQMALTYVQLLLFFYNNHIVVVEYERLMNMLV